MNNFRFLILFIFLVFSNLLFSQKKVLNVWTGKIPAAIENPNYIAVTDSNDNWIKTRRITNPTLDFYPAQKDNNSGIAVIICPGGGYWGVAVYHEGQQIAEWLNNVGISAFVLKYRLPDSSIMKNKAIGPLQDAQEAIRQVRRHAKEWNIDPSKIGIMGFSAGGHLAASASTHFRDNLYESMDTTSARPDFSILVYPVISMDSSITHMGSRENLLGKNPSTDLVKYFSNELQVSTQTPPCFLIHSMDDNVVPVENSIRYALALKKYNIPCELHIYEKGGHGYGLGRSSLGTEIFWSKACENWLKARGFILIK